MEMQNDRRLIECPICGMSYSPNLPEDIEAHTQSHQAILKGAIPFSVREFLKEQGWVVARGTDKGGRWGPADGKRAIAFAWWARAREAGLPDADSDDYMLTQLAYIDAQLAGDEAERKKTDNEAKARWGQVR